MSLKKSLVLTVSVLAITCAMSISVSANTLSVGPAVGSCTGTYPTISAAVAAASPGDTIKVCPGSYHELVNVNKQLTLRGAQATVDARSGARTGLPATESVVDGNAGTTSFYITANDVTLDGFTIQNATNVNQFGAGIVLGGGTSGAHVLNNIVQNNIIGLSLANNPSGQSALIQHNMFRNNNQPGPATGSGIYTDEFNAGGALANVTIDANSFTGNQDAGIDFSSTLVGSQSNVTMSNNLFDGNGRAFFLLNLTSSQIITNTLQNAAEPGTADIRIFGGVNGLTIHCNVLKNGAGRAIRVGDGIGGDPNSNIAVNDNNISGYPIGLVVDSGSYSGTLDARNDWWGSSTGPTDPRNPMGTGESIVDPDQVVKFIPFRTAPVPDVDNDGILDPCDPQVGPPTNKDQCKDDGWKNFTFPRTFKNQGDCIQYVNTGK